MTKTIVNLTLPVVVDQIETALKDYPYHPYQQAFAIPDLRQRLIAYVLSRISNNYTVLEEGENLTHATNCSSERILQIKKNSDARHPRYFTAVLGMEHSPHSL